MRSIRVAAVVLSTVPLVGCPARAISFEAPISELEPTRRALNDVGAFNNLTVLDAEPRQYPSGYVGYRFVLFGWIIPEGHGAREAAFVLEASEAKGVIAIDQIPMALVDPICKALRNNSVHFSVIYDGHAEKQDKCES